MEQKQEHIATLCAIGTVGIAAAGLALGTRGDGDAYLIKPGKRKASGAHATPSPQTSTPPFPPRRVVSQPVAATPLPSEKALSAMGTSVFRRRIVRDFEKESTTASTVTQSRGSSSSRHDALRPWTAERDSSTERREARPGSSWLRRLSTISYGHNSSPGSSVSRMDMATGTWTPASDPLTLPNKLVKRSSSIRLPSADGDHGRVLRRPATSRQRSATLSALSTPMPVAEDTVTGRITSGEAAPDQGWRPFFDRGSSRKGHSGGGRDHGAKIISASPNWPPTLVLGSAVQRRDGVDDEDSGPASSQPSRPPSSALTAPLSSTRRHKLRRTLGSVRRAASQRHFTDPVVDATPDYGSFVPRTKYASSSPLSNMSGFDVDLRQGPTVFTSSPPSFTPPPHRFTMPKRVSVARSDPTTASSDNDIRVFTDDDSMDFQSDTAYDSLATRATVSSHSGFRPPKIETIFDDPPLPEPGPPDVLTIEDLMHRTTLNDPAVDLEQHPDPPPAAISVGIGISGFQDGNGSTTEDGSHDDPVLTPVKSRKSSAEETTATPVPKKARYARLAFESSPSHQAEEEVVGIDSDDEKIRWSPPLEKDMDDHRLMTIPASPVRLAFDHPHDPGSSQKRSSIFDWSEHQKFDSDPANGISPRPKTVHGKQGTEGGRSRPPGRKGNNAMHLRSQSVPVNRETSAETDLPPSVVKFGTWGLGHKPVSEEWGDDFEFDDVDEAEDEEAADIIADGHDPGPRDPMRSVRVPQSIIDRQESLHLQFSQVQEFMLLVEELKRLRVQGAALKLLEAHAGGQLWQEADAIINLATLNEDEDPRPRPPSPGWSDIFSEDTPPSKKAAHDADATAEYGRRNSTTRRSISSPASSPYGRPRGESLAQARSILQNIHQTRGGVEGSPAEAVGQRREKLAFDTQDLRDLVVRAGAITRALKEIVRNAEGVSVSPDKTPPKSPTPTFSHIFNPPDTSPSPPLKNPGLPKSRSTNSYLGGGVGTTNENEIPQSLNFTAVEAN